MYGTGAKAAEKQDTTLGVTVLRVRKGKISDFKDFNLDKEQRNTVPHYVEVKYENLGDLKLQRFLMDPAIEDTDGQEYKPLNLIVLSGTFKKCPQPSKARLRGGQSFTLCAPFLLPHGQDLRARALPGRRHAGPVLLEVTAAIRGTRPPTAACRARGRFQRRLGARRLAAAARWKSALRACVMAMCS